MKNTEFVALAKPLEWAATTDGKQWDDNRHGFSITYDPEEDKDYRYFASWGEGPEDTFSTLDAAKAWCQNTIDGWVRENVIVVAQSGAEKP